MPLNRLNYFWTLEPIFSNNVPFYLNWGPITTYTIFNIRYWKKTSITFNGSLRGLLPCDSLFGKKFNIFFQQNGLRYQYAFFPYCSFIPQDKKIYLHEKLEKKFRGIVVLERDLVGKLEPKCNHDFSIPCRLKQKSVTQF